MELRPIVNKPKSKPKPDAKKQADAVVVETMPAKCKPRINWTVVVVAVAALWFFAGRPTPGPDPYDDDREEQIDDDRQAISGSWLVFVLEKTSPSADQAEVLNDVAFFEELKQKGMIAYRTYDDDQAEAKPYIDYANGRGLSPPLVAVVKDREIVLTKPFKDRTSVTEAIR
jgi:hypothetical protein